MASWCAGTPAIVSAAREQLERVDAPVAVVDVARHHVLGQLVAARTGVRHQSPQAIVLRGGRAVWSASHVAITAEALRRALAAAGREQHAPEETAEGGPTARPWWKIW